MQQLLNNYRNMFLFRGIAAIVFGVLTLVWPKLTVLALVVLFGIFAIISGISVVAAALQNREVARMGSVSLRGNPVAPGGSGGPDLAGRHRALFPLPAGGLGRHYRHS